jgi:hypothetical protein
MNGVPVQRGVDVGSAGQAAGIELELDRREPGVECPFAELRQAGLFGDPVEAALLGWVGDRHGEHVRTERLGEVLLRVARGVGPEEAGVAVATFLSAGDRRFTTRLEFVEETGSPELIDPLGDE